MKKNVAIGYLGALALGFLASTGTAIACSRFTYEGAAGSYYVGRSMDWMEDIGTNLWSFPRGMARDGGVGPRSIKWTSKYGSVVATAYDIGTADGLNEGGLVVNLLYLAESDFGDAATSGKPLLSLGAWAQYALDNFATVSEAVEALRQEPFSIVAAAAPNGKAGTVHLALTDATGDNAIFEYVAGKLVIHHGRDYRVMTNSPLYEQQLAINEYWKEVNGLAALPGTHRASDRFARLSWNLNAAPREADPRLATATTFSLIRTVSVPLGLKDPEKPNISATIWRTVTDIGQRRYYYDSSYSPNVFWVDLGKLKLEPGSKPMKLDLSSRPVIAGEASKLFRPAEPFKFISP
jgi:choloylglycine hydrolase